MEKRAKYTLTLRRGGKNISERQVTVKDSTIEDVVLDKVYEYVGLHSDVPDWNVTRLTRTHYKIFDGTLPNVEVLAIPVRNYKQEH